MTEIGAGPTADRDLCQALCRELIALAESEEQEAAAEAAETPYWLAQPETVAARRHTARALRASAARLDARTRG